MRSFSGIFSVCPTIAPSSVRSLAVAFSVYFSAVVFRAFFCSNFSPVLFVRAFLCVRSQVLFLCSFFAGRVFSCAVLQQFFPRVSCKRFYCTHYHQCFFRGLLEGDFVGALIRKGFYLAPFHSSFFLRCFLWESFVHSFAGTPSVYFPQKLFHVRSISGVFAVRFRAGAFFRTLFQEALSARFFAGFFRVLFYKGIFRVHFFA